MKELFFSGSESPEFPVNRVRIMMMQISIPIDEDLQQTFSFFEKVEYVLVFQHCPVVFCSRIFSFYFHDQYSLSFCTVLIFYVVFFLFEICCLS